MDWLKDHLMETIYGGCVALLGAAFTWVKIKLNRQRQEQEAVNEGVRALLHDRLYQACQHYITQGWCSIEDRKNVEYMFNPYHRLGGNGTCQHLFEEVQDLPLEAPKTEKGENQK